MRKGRSVHSPNPNVADVAALIGDPTRAAMLLTLLSGTAHSASELAYRGGASPQAASAHLRKLMEGGLLTVAVSGRQRLYRLATREVAQAIEALSSIAAPPCIAALTQSIAAERLREARTCYDHLAGRLGVAVTDALVTRGALHANGSEFHLTPRGERFFADLEIDVLTLRHGRRELARACMDWTERRPHLAGSLGKALLDCFVANRWIARFTEDRYVRLTEHGQRVVPRLFGMHLPRHTSGAREPFQM